MPNKKNKISVVAILILLFFGLSITITAGFAQPPEKPGKPDNPGNQNNQNNTNLSSFQDTQPINNVSPNNLSGKIRVEKQYQKNTSVKLIRNRSTNYSIDITITENAENVSFYLQSQAVESSQNISNVTMKLDGQNHTFVMENAGPGNSPWIGFKIPEFSTRTVSFVSSQETSIVDRYDTDNSGEIQRNELRTAILDFIDKDITRSELRKIILQFVQDQT